MRTRTIMASSFLAFGLAYGAFLSAHLSAPMPSGLGQSQLEPVRGSLDAKYQPQDGKVTVQVRHTRDSPVSTVAVAYRDACPRCAIGE